MDQQRKAQVIDQASLACGRADEAARRALGSVWDAAYEEGRLAALDELQDRFCVCTK